MVCPSFFILVSEWLRVDALCPLMCVDWLTSVCIDGKQFSIQNACSSYDGLGSPVVVLRLSHLMPLLDVPDNTEHIRHGMLLCIGCLLPKGRIIYAPINAISLSPPLCFSTFIFVCSVAISYQLNEAHA